MSFTQDNKEHLKYVLESNTTLEELGFKVYSDFKFKTDNDLIAYCNEENDIYIYFYKDKTIELRCDLGIDYKIYLAIEQKMKEFGWI